MQPDRLLLLLPLQAERVAVAVPAPAPTDDEKQVEVTAAVAGRELHSSGSLLRRQREARERRCNACKTSSSQVHVANKALTSCKRQKEKSRRIPVNLHAILSLTHLPVLLLVCELSVYLA